MIRLPDLSGTRVLITGGLGFIGSNLAHRCLELGAQVTVYDSLDRQSGANIVNIAEIEDRVSVIIDDIRSFDRVAPAVQRSDILFNCAAFTSHSMSMKQPATVVDVNCQGLLTLLEAARQLNDDIRFVQVGTSTQIGRMVENPVTELHPEFPLDLYSASKTAAEKFVLVYGSGHGLPVTVVRLTNVFGPRAAIKSPDFGFVNYFVGLALQDKELTVYGDGEQLRDITFVDDVVDALILASVSESALRQVLFAGASRHHTVREIAEAIVREIGGRVTSIAWPKEREVTEVGAAVISSARAKSLLGWDARTNLHDGLMATRDYFRPRLRDYLS
jgi:UDP-glucose 4-epimerase